MKCTFIYNANSGKGKIGRKIGAIERRLREIFGEVTVFGTANATETTERARACEEGSALVVAGGDGTFGAAVQGVASRDVALGYLPVGTVNDAAGSLGIPRRLRGALRVIVRGRTAQIDCLQVNGERCAFNIVAAGSLTRVTYETPQRKKRRLGWFAYAFAVLKRLYRMEPFYAEAESGGTRAEGEFVLALVMNGKKLARFSVDRGADLADGRCETLLVRQNGRGFFARRAAMWATVRLVLFGRKRSGKRVVRLCGENVCIRKTDSVLWDFDGERGFEGEIDVHVSAGALKVFVPS